MNDSIITPINIISLDSATYGNDLNDRLEIINNNFTKIIQSDFLQGIPGNTIGIICVNFDETVPNDGSKFATVDNDTNIIQVPNHLIDNGTTSDLYYYPTQDDENYIGVTIDNLKDKLKEAIINVPNDTTRYDLINLDGYSITLYYEYNVTIGKYFLVSSLPFIYYDKYALDELANNTEVEDLSCALVYSKNKDEYGFRSIHPFPQIYYDRNQSNGNLCWKINGIETGISCQGVQGTNGRNGSTYMVYVDTEQSNKNGLCVSEIYGILKLMPNAKNSTIYSPEVIEPTDFKDNGIFIEQGDVLICVPATETKTTTTDGDVYTYTPNNSNSVYISIAHIIQNGNETEYYVLSDVNYISYITPLDTNAVGLLYNGLSCIGFDGSDNVKPLRGLFIPTGLTNTSSESREGTEDTTENTTEDTISGHMLWESKEETNDKDINILNISHVKNVNVPIVDEDHNSELKIHYSTVHVNDLRVNGKLINGLIEIEYDDLKTQKNDGKLYPGQLYRITDYITTTSQTGTNSANHQFDIIVLALSENKLSERAWAIQHEFDNPESNEANYFKNSKLEAWQLWYCLDNDKDRFAWATTNGKGVIYRMIDEFGNDCPYDFKNIRLYYQPMLSGEENFYYTFNGSSFFQSDPDIDIPGIPGDDADWSLTGDIKNNRVYYGRPYGHSYNKNNKILKITFESSIQHIISGISYNFCCNNNIINSDEIIICTGRNNTVMSSYNIKLRADNCNIPTGSSDLEALHSDTIYLNNVAAATAKYGHGLLNNIRTIDEQIMVIPSMFYEKDLDKDPEDGGVLFGLTSAGDDSLINAYNFSIKDHVRRIGDKNDPNFCISIPEYVHTVIINGPLYDNENTYIELPRGCSRGHTINIIEREAENCYDETNLNDVYKIITPVNLQDNSREYNGDIIIDGKMQKTGERIIFQGTKDTLISIGNIVPEDLIITYAFYAVNLGKNTCKKMIYTGDLSPVAKDGGVWMSI